MPSSAGLASAPLRPVQPQSSGGIGTGGVAERMRAGECDRWRMGVAGGRRARLHQRSYRIAAWRRPDIDDGASMAGGAGRAARTAGDHADRRSGRTNRVTGDAGELAGAALRFRRNPRRTASAST